MTTETYAPNGYACCDAQDAPGEDTRPMGIPTLSDLVNALSGPYVPYEEALSNLIASATRFRANRDSRGAFCDYVKARDIFDAVMRRECNAHLNL